jgi:DNA-binding response OmpR family regulator
MLRSKIDERIDGLSKKILIVDDDTHSVMLMRGRLSALGFEIDEAFSIEGAKERLSAQAYDLMVLDFFLPDGSGDEICRAVRKGSDTKALPIIILSDLLFKDEEKFLETGANEVVYKPVDVDDLAGRVKKHLER